MVELSWIVGLTYCSGLLLVAYYDRTSSWKLLSWYYYAATVVLLLGPGVVVANALEWWHARRGQREDLQPATATPGRLVVGLGAAAVVVVVAGLAGFATR